jgi:hypothetical protein
LIFSTPSRDLSFAHGDMQDESFGAHATAILALASILSNVDSLEEVTKSLVGTTVFPGYAGVRGLRGGGQV